MKNDLEGGNYFNRGHSGLKKQDRPTKKSLELHSFDNARDRDYLEHILQGINSDALGRIVSKFLEKSDMKPSEKGVFYDAHYGRNFPIFLEPVNQDAATTERSHPFITIYPETIMRYMIRRDGFVPKLSDWILSQFKDRNEYYRKLSRVREDFIPVFVRVYIHELLHAHSKTINSDAGEFERGPAKGWQTTLLEGVNDLATFVVAASYFNSQGSFPENDSRLKSFIRGCGYSQYMSAVLRLAEIIGETEGVDPDAVIGSFFRAQFNEGVIEDYFKDVAPEVQTAFGDLLYMSRGGRSSRKYDLALMADPKGFNPSSTDEEYVEKVFAFVKRASDRIS